MKISPFDTYIQTIDGAAEIIIKDKNYILKIGDGIIIPAHAKHCFKANEPFKMLATVIKSGYEDQKKVKAMQSKISKLIV